MGKYIIFSCNQQKLAVPIEVTDKILLFEKPTRVPDTSKYLLGVLPYEGKRLGVIDLKKRLFQDKLQPDEDSKIMVVHWKGIKLGLAVENVMTVREFEEQANKKAVKDGEVTDYIIEMFQTNEEIIMHIDVDQLLSDEGIQEMKRILEK